MVLWVVAAAGSALILVVTHPWGIGFVSDSESYLMAARSLVDGDGLSVFRNGTSVPLTAFPPLYPILLASLGWAGVDPAVTGRCLSVVLFGLMLAFTGLVVSRGSRGSRVAPLLAMGIVGTSYNVLQVYGYVLSEQVFLVLLLLCLLKLSDYLETGRRSHFWVTVSVVGAACLTRYAGVALLGAGTVVLLFSPTGSSRRKVEDAVAFGVLGGLPLALWMLHNVASGFRAAGRPLSPEVSGFDAPMQMALLVGSWFVPDVMGGALRVIGLLLGLFFFFLAILGTTGLFRKGWAETLRAELQAADRSCLVFLFSYMCMVGVLLFLSNAGLATEARVLVPAQVAVVVLAGGWLAKLYRAGSNRRATQLMVRAAVIGILALNFAWAGAWSVWKFRNGSGFVSEKWLANRILDGVRALPSRAVIYSNHPGAIYCMAGRPATMLPGGNPEASVLSKRTEFLAMREKLHNRGGVIVIFPWVHHEGILSIEEIEHALNPVSTQRAPNGTAYFFSDGTRVVLDSAREQVRSGTQPGGYVFKCASAPMGGNLHEPGGPGEPLRMDA